MLGVVSFLSSSSSSFLNICKKKKKERKIWRKGVPENMCCDRVTVHCGRCISSSQRPLAVLQTASLPLVVSFHLCLFFVGMISTPMNKDKLIKKCLESFHSECLLLSWPWKLWFIQGGVVSFTGGTLIDRAWRGQEQEEEVSLSIYGRNTATVTTETHAGVSEGGRGFFG